VTASLQRHWPEYLMEAAELGLFMLAACAFGVVLEHPASPVPQALGDAFCRRALMGAAMGATAIAIVYSPWGQQSGAHFNPAVTLTFWRLGKVKGWDALFYVLSQTAGGLAGVVIARLLLGDALAHAAVNFVATVPGPSLSLAFAAEAGMTFLVMSVVLGVADQERLAPWTGVFVGCLVATFITFEAPLSGMSLNPARSLASAWPSGAWMGFWIYLAAPPLGMLAAAEVHHRARGARAAHCAKLHHQNGRRCIFCGQGMAPDPPPASAPAASSFAD
jgi:aquaporin Z